MNEKIWNEFVTKEEKEIQSHSVFLRKFKTKLLDSDKEILLCSLPPVSLSMN